MRSRYLCFLCVMVLCFIAGLSVMRYCYAASATVLGIVQNTLFQPIPGASMKIYNSSNTYGPKDRDSNGYYSFTVTPGTYTLKATASGYVTGYRTVTLSPNETEQQDFILHPSFSPSSQEVSEQDGSEISLENAIQILEDIKNQILLLDPAAFKTPDRQDALVKKYDMAIRNIQEGRNDLALRKLQYGILIRINGCNRLGRSDGNDWITDCEAQRLVHDSTEEVRASITRRGTTDPIILASPGRFTGTVTVLGTTDPIPGPRMYFDGPNHTYKDRNSAGNYTSAWMDPGTYTITVTASGYITITDSGVTLPEGQTKVKNYEMMPDTRPH